MAPPVRPPAVAGSFYPATVRGLRDALQKLCPTAVPPSPAIALVAPHAGYVYSGALAGSVWSRVIIPDTVLLLAPNHTGMGSRFGVWAKGAWETPLGSLPVDEDMASELLDTVPGISADIRSHQREHSLEVHLPFLQHLRPDVKIVPVSVSISDADDIGEAGAAIARVVSSRKVLIAASTDMTHFASARKAAEMDAPALAAVERLDWRGLLSYVLGNRVSMCGVRPVALALAASARLGAKRADLVGYTHSGVVTGDTGEVVAYAGFVIPREK